MAVTRRPAVFIDKDGTLIKDVPYNVRPELIALYPDAAISLAALQRAGYKIIVVSNQSGVARGIFTAEDLQPVSDAIRDRLQPHGVNLTAIYYCPHSAVDGCYCRKPRSGMLRQAAAEHGIDLTASWMVGDILNDVEAGNRAGCRTILIDNGNETEWLPGPHRAPFATVGSLTAAARTIITTKHKETNHETQFAGHHLALHR
ncbi:HAD family hydrolase [Candidatus Saccharibacteria bacterium]|nr:HAD family hydrolase [Candidatus Saccharibacteria bacterium]